MIVLTISTQKQAVILISAIFLASLSLCYSVYNQQLPTESIKKAMCDRVTILTASYTMSATTFVSNDSNWAGYIVASDLQNPQATVTGVSASWTVPRVVTSLQENEFSAVWIGIGGFFDQTLIQTGTEQDSIQGQAEYSVWYELLPQNSVTIDTIAVSPGDQISASIQLTNPNTNEWTIDIKDITTNQEYNNNFVYAASELSAEWIVERPEISIRRSQGTLANLANIGNVAITNCQATVGGKSGAISSFPTVESIMYSTVDRTSGAGATQLTAVSDLAGNGSSFAVETSPLAVPEMSFWASLTTIMGATTLVILMKKHIVFRKNFPS